MIMGVDQVKNYALNAQTPVSRLAEIKLGSGYVTAQNGFNFTLNQVADRRTVRSSHVGTRKRAALIGKLRQTEHNDTVISVNI